MELDYDFDLICKSRLEKFDSFYPEDDRDEQPEPIDLGDGICEISLVGEIGDDITYDKVKSLLQMACGKNTKKVLLSLESPGGSANESIAIDELINEYERQGIEFTVYSNRLIASGGYLLSSGRKQVYISPVAYTGSIGAISQFPTLKKMYEKMGVEWNIFKTGEYKSFPSSEEELTQEQKDYLQNRVNEIGTAFIEHVARTRKIDKEGIINLKGAVFNAKKSLSLGLVDGIKSKEQVINMLKNDISSNLLLINNVNNTEPIIDSMEIEKDKQIEALNAELKAAKLDKIQEFSRGYQLATGQVCPESKLQSLEKLSIEEIKAEIDFYKPLIKAKYEQKPVVETTIKEGSMQMDAKQSDKLQDSVHMFEVVSNAARIKAPGFNKESALNSLKAKIGGLL